MSPESGSSGFESQYLLGEWLLFPHFLIGKRCAADEVSLKNVKHSAQYLVRSKQ